MELCNILPARLNELLRHYGYYGDDQKECDASCVLPYAHFCLCHVFRLPDGRYIKWEDDYDCDCCEPDEEDRCYSSGEVSKEEVDKLIKENS